MRITPCCSNMKNDMVRDLLPPPLTTPEETYPYFDLGRPRDTTTINVGRTLLFKKRLPT